ncbi:LAGLIDADG family homing endonuclease [Streptomyces sp. NPDC048182]|uniref:LAGLIDADG family homing endonuclease n=1 Tax=Streptomyces sp. NPDC048182 TaxID=3365507 RepID=UPI003714A9BA
MAESQASGRQFMDLSVPEYSYMFGFLQADGHLTPGTGKKGRLSVEINARDVHLLREFQRLTPYYSSVRERSRSTNFAAIWTLCSLEARTLLNGLGLPYGRKSDGIAPPSSGFSPRDYLRGVVDADGSVGLTSKGYPFVSLTTASTELAAFFCQYGQEVTGLERSSKRNARDAVYNVLYMMEGAQSLASHLYYRGCLALERKRRAAISLGDWKRPATMRAVHTRRRWTPCEDRILLKLGSPAAASEALGRTVQSCSLRLWRLRSGQTPEPSST